ncbi:MAG: 2,3-diketo-L-gulonate TRAP transporter substrate-binding protein YiaO, partial [Escherichia coli]
MKLRSVTYALLIAGVATFSTSSLAAQSLRFGYETSQTDSQHIAAKKFNELLQEKTKGELKLKLFPDSTLGNAQAMISGVRGGTIDMEMSGSNNFTGLSPVINLLDVPFLFRDTAHAHK